jgi:hypothetical protein
MRQSIPTDDVVAVIAFLCSHQACVIGGAAIPVYGWA